MAEITGNQIERLEEAVKIYTAIDGGAMTDEEVYHRIEGHMESLCVPTLAEVKVNYPFTHFIARTNPNMVPLLKRICYMSEHNENSKEKDERWNEDIKKTLQRVVGPLVKNMLKYQSDMSLTWDSESEERIILIVIMELFLL